MGRGVLQEDGREPEGEGDEKDQEHALGLAEAERLEPVVDVVLAHVGQPLVEAPHLARDDAVHGHEGDVEEGDRQDQDGRAEGDQGVVPRPFPHDRQPRQAEADEAGAPVPEEHVSGGAGAEVVRQESEAGAQERRREEHEVGLPSLERGDADEEARDGAEPRGQAVHPVEKLDGVRHREEPQDGQEEVEPDGARPVLRDDPERDPVPQGGQRAGDLARELHDGGKAEHVVEDAHDDHDRGADRDALELAGKVEVVEHRQREGRPHGGAAQERRGNRVNLPRVGLVQDPEPQGRRANEGNEQEGEREGEEPEIRPEEPRPDGPPLHRRQQEDDREDQPAPVEGEPGGEGQLPAGGERRARPVAHGFSRASTSASDTRRASASVSAG